MPEQLCVSRLIFALPSPSVMVPSGQEGPQGKGCLPQAHTKNCLINREEKNKTKITSKAVSESTFIKMGPVTIEQGGN